MVQGVHSHACEGEEIEKLERQTDKMVDKNRQYEAQLEGAKEEKRKIKFARDQELDKITQESLNNLIKMVSKGPKDPLALFIVETLNECAYGNGAKLDLSKEWTDVSQIIGSIRHANLRKLEKEKLRDHCIKTKGGTGVMDFDGLNYKRFMQAKATKPFLEHFFKALQMTLYLATLQIRCDDLKVKIEAINKTMRAYKVRIGAFHALSDSVPQIMLMHEASRIRNDELAHLHHKQKALEHRKRQIEEEEQEHGDYFEEYFAEFN